MYLLLPTLVRLFRPDISNAPPEIRRAAIKTLGRILPSMQVGSVVLFLLSPVVFLSDSGLHACGKIVLLRKWGRNSVISEFL